MSVGLGSLEELILLYVWSGFVVGLIWASLEAGIVLDDVGSWSRGEAARLRRTRLLAPLGAIHVGFALVALSAARSHGAADAPAGRTRSQRRATVEATSALAVGTLVFAATAAAVA